MMNIGVLGTGIVGQAIAGRCEELSHDVMVGTRDPQATLARAEPDRCGGPPFSVFADKHPRTGLGTFADVAAHGELVVNAAEGAASVEALTAGSENLEGKVLLDVSNPLDASGGMPPSLFVSNTYSLAEQIRRAFPHAHVVKSLNTMNASVMVNPEQLAEGEHSVFVSGDDAEAKATVTELLRSFGWRDIVDLGDLSTARGAEMYVALWVRLWSVVQNPIFNVKVCGSEVHARTDRRRMLEIPGPGWTPRPIATSGPSAVVPVVTTRSRSGSRRADPPCTLLSGGGRRSDWSATCRGRRRSLAEGPGLRVAPEPWG